MITVLNARFKLTAAGTFAAALVAASAAFADTPATDTAASSAMTEPPLADIVVTATRTPTAIDHIPGSITVISSVDLSRIQLASNDPDQVLAQAIPGYTASMD
ncbi:MAG: hypothetical protein ACREFT_05350, partial [Acetobacteraceae bacterium]